MTAADAGHAASQHLLNVISAVGWFPPCEPCPSGLESRRIALPSLPSLLEADVQRDLGAGSGTSTPWAVGAKVLLDWFWQRQLVSGAGGGVHLLMLQQLGRGGGSRARSQTSPGRDSGHCSWKLSQIRELSHSSL